MAKAIELYVSPEGNEHNNGSLEHPFATIENARDAIRRLNRDMDRDIIVYLRGGEYPVVNPITLDERDSGSNGHYITYCSYPGEKPILSGARRITGWVNENGLFKTNIGAGIKLRELFVNGKRARRARSESFKILSWDEEKQIFNLNSPAVAGWATVDPEMEAVILQHWVLNYFRLGSFHDNCDGTASLLLEPDNKRNDFFNDPHPGRDLELSVHFENSLKYMDKPGDWCLETRTGDLYYLPRQGETLQDLNVVTPGLETIMKLTGTDSNKRIKNIRITGITFEYTKWQAFIDEDGIIPQQADMSEFRSDNRPTAALYMDCAENIIIERNLICHTANAGIDIHSRSINNVIIGNVFTDIGSNGIQEGLFNEAGAKMLSVQGNIFRNNYMKGISVTSSGVAIACGYTNGVVIENNEISDCPYSGISVGWGWSTQPTCLGNNKIRNNHIYNVLNKLSDGGAIYTLSRQPESEITGNYIHDVDRSEWCGASAVATIYLDEGTQGYRVSNNVFRRVGQTLNGTSRFYPSNLLENNDSQDQDIMDKAGLEPEYMDIVPGVIINHKNEWVAPGRCSLTISGTVRPLNTCLGINASILKNGEILWNETIVSKEGASYHKNIDLSEDDIISFNAANGENETKDIAAWSHRISVQQYAPLLNITKIALPSGQIGEPEIDYFYKRIIIRVSEDTDVTNIAPALATPSGTVVEPASGESRDFSQIVIYTVRMEEGSKYLDFDGGRKFKNWKVLVLKDQPVSCISGYPIDREIADPDNWFVSGGTKTVLQDRLRFDNGYSIYQAKTFKDEIFEFNLCLNVSGWPSLLLRNKHKETGLFTEDSEGYLITIKDIGVEVQRFNGVKRTVFYGDAGGTPRVYGNGIPNLYFDYGKDNRIHAGAVNSGEDVRLFLYINGRKVFDCIDKLEGKITTPGYFGTYQSGDASFAVLSK